MSNEHSNSSDKIKKIFQDQLEIQKNTSQQTESTAPDNRLVFIVMGCFFIVRVIFIYLGYFLLHKNLGFPLHFNFLDFLLIMFGVINGIGLIKKSLKD